MDVLRCSPVTRRPIWFMRQAGRYLPEYRKVREQAGSFLELCYNPAAAAEVTVQPLRRFDIDAAILFADILVVPHAMGLDLRFEDGEGPLLGTVRDVQEVNALKQLENSWQLKSICETVALASEGIAKHVAMIGFCGGPWTVACYMIEGKSSDWQFAKLVAYRRESWFIRLIERLVEESVEYLSAQIDAGVEVVQVFDSWAGELTGRLRREFVIAPLSEMTRRLHERHPNVPIILFAKGLGTDHGTLAEASKCAALGIEAELSMSWAAGNIGHEMVLQGNLDPISLLGGEQIAASEAVELAKAIPSYRHIFNLGHGIKVGTAPETIGAVVEAVRNWDRAHASP
ncbi:MAG: uroporphyrinogen decarboxylase [Rhizobiales bacterium]|nr:uroporphyrinogen decarboxylase [Hyphomicrobiales bacterium]